MLHRSANITARARDDVAKGISTLHVTRGGRKGRRFVLFRARLDPKRVCAVNWPEVVQKSLQRGVEVTGMRAEFAEIGMVFEPFTATQAETAAQLWGTNRRRGGLDADVGILRRLYGEAGTGQRYLSGGGRMQPQRHPKSHQHVQTISNSP